MKKNITKKNNWHCPEITRIALNPEQAVLSCCESVTRQAFVATSSIQCEICGGTPSVLGSS
ncbi:MAG: hypothetical protein PHP69_03465 [Candidatus Omnitrophica bacterium]|nr:hypothetical protein [Candidatus Omnitrophota bacterium]MDD5080902.1 hypothetical protein [Candidatus Omnitrophota bacterium]